MINFKSRKKLIEANVKLIQLLKAEKLDKEAWINRFMIESETLEKLAKKYNEVSQIYLVKIIK